MSDFKVQGRLGLDGSGFFSTLGKAESAVGKIGGMLAGAFSVGAIVSFSKSVLDLAGKLNDVSEALGINVEFLQKFVNSAAKSGGGLGDVEKFLFESNKSRQAAVNDPSKKEGMAFAQLGFSQSDISTLNPQQFMEKLIVAFKDGASAQDINALAEIGGKSAKKLVGAFKEGLDEATAVMSEDTVMGLDEVGDKFTSMSQTLMSSLAPALLLVLGGIQELIDYVDRLATGIAEGLFSPDEAAKFEEDQANIARQKALLAAQGKTSSVDLVNPQGTFTQGVIDKAKEQEERDRKAAVLAAEKKAAKAASDAASPDFKAEEVAVKAKQGAGVYSDSRLAVGGFLGAGGGASLSSIAERSLQVQTQQLNVAKQMLDKLKSGDVPLTLIIP